MRQVDVDDSIGYTLKQVTWALRSAMDDCVREFGLTVPQYATLEVLARTPGISNAHLARAVFVSRQATHQLLAAMRRNGLVEATGAGRDQRFTLTDDGESRRRRASQAVAAVEDHMLGPLDGAQRVSLKRDLDACLDGLRADGVTSPASE